MKAVNISIHLAKTVCPKIQLVKGAAQGSALLEGLN